MQRKAEIEPFTENENLLKKIKNDAAALLDEKFERK